MLTDLPSSFRLMLNRIKWEDEIIKDNEGMEVPNRCVLVWEVSAERLNFRIILKFIVLPGH